VLGVGTGESVNEVPATGLKWPEPTERFARLREALRLIRQLWKEDRVSFDGEFYKTVNATIYDRPKVPVPIYVAGAGPMISKYAGSTSEGFICTSGKDQSLYTETLLPNVEAGLKQAGRTPDAIDRMIEVKVSFDPDLKRAREDTRNWAALSLSAEEKLSVEDPLEMERLADALPVERAAQRWIVSSDPDEHVERIETYVDLGFRHLVFHAPGKDQVRFIRLYAEQILPRLKTS
jgi:coenzyme F420-dependent glucose-6-phosphate dehydrogenase